MLEIKNVMKWNVSNTMTVIQMTQIFVLNRSTMSPTANVKYVGNSGSGKLEVRHLSVED